MSHQVVSLQLDILDEDNGHEKSDVVSMAAAIPHQEQNIDATHPCTIITWVEEAHQKVEEGMPI
jgi:hypothetical protein